MTGTEEILGLAVAVVLLAFVVFRFDWLFHSRKRSSERPPAPKSARRMVVVYDDEDEDESSESSHKG
jgi:hypothetical protein